MADEEKVEPQEQPETKKADFDPEAFKAEIAKEFKKEIAGLNRRNSELEKELEETKKKEMSQEEVLEFERKKLEAAHAELAETRAGLLRSNIAAETGLVPEAISFLTATDEEGIRLQSEKLKALIDSASERMTRDEIEKRFKDSPKPTAGTAGGEMSQQEFLQMTDEQLQALGAKKVAELTRKFAGL